MFGTQDLLFQPNDIAQVNFGLGILPLVIERVSEAASAPKCVGVFRPKDLVLEVDDLLEFTRGFRMLALPVQT